MDKKKFGKYFYHASLFLTILTMIAALFIFKSDGSDEQNLTVSIIRYAIAYYSFIAVLGTGLVVNEYCSGKFEKKKMRLKLVAIIAGSLIGAPIFIFVNNASVACMMFFVSLLLLIYILTPTVKEDGKKI